MKDDITIEELSGRNSALTSLLDYMFDGVYIVDRQRKIVFWNKGAELLTGYTYEEVKGRRCSDNILNHVDENGELLCTKRCMLVSVFGNNEPIHIKVYPLHKSGKRFPVSTHIAPIYNRQGEVIAAIEVFRDISREEELRTLQEKFNDFIRRYVSETTLAAALESAQSGEASRARMRELTVAFMDLVSFTSYSENNSPETVVGMLNEVFAICGALIKEEGGDIDKFLGDCILAVFSDPNAAVRASEKILAELIKLNELKESKANDDRVRMHIGINTGLVLQGDIGTAERKDLTIIGDVVNIASRIQAQAVPDSIYISEATLLRLADQAAFELVGEVKVKNRTEPVHIYRHRQHPPL